MLNECCHYFNLVFSNGKLCQGGEEAHRKRSTLTSWLQEPPRHVPMITSYFMAVFSYWFSWCLLF